MKTAPKLLSDIINMPKAYRGVVVLDIEGNSADVRAFPGSRNEQSLTLGLSYAYRLGRATAPITSGYLSFNHKDYTLPREYLSILREILESEVNHPVFHNAKYDLVGLRNDLGIDLFHTKFYCTLLMAHQVNENRISYKLDDITQVYDLKGKNKTDAHEAIAKAFGWEYIPVWMMYEYSENDAVITYQLFEKLLPEVNRHGLGGEYWDVEREWHRLIEHMEAMGIPIDSDLCETEAEFGEARKQEIASLLGGNPASPRFLEVLLLDRLNLPVFKTSDKTGRPSFSKEYMAEYETLLAEKNDPTAQLVLEYRGWQKTVSSNYRAYLNLLSPDGYLRPNYKLHGTVSSRLSCEKPNLQQIPRSSTKRWNGSLKRAFIPREGYHLWEADFSNLELRVASVYAEEQNLIHAFQRGIKPFDDMAGRLGWPRQDCKTFTYTVLFGGGEQRVSDVFHVERPRARAMRSEFFEAYPAMAAFSKQASQRARIRGYVKLWTGRRRHFLNPKEENHKAMNSIVQGGAAELVKRVGIRLGKLVDWNDCRILLQIHDSYTFEVKNGTEDYWLPKIREAMEDVGSIFGPFGEVPFPVEIKPWGE